MKPVSLVDREIEAKIDAAVQAHVESGKKPSDMGRSDFLAIALAAHAKMSPAAIKKAAIDGLTHMASFVLGGIIAEAIWAAGHGWPSDDAGCLTAYRTITFRGKPLKVGSDQEALECIRIFREDLPELTREEFEDRCDAVLIDRFRPIFEGEPAGAAIGEIAIRKVAFGDPLALAFLSWTPPAPS